MTTLATGLTNPQAIAIDASYVYFAEYSTGGTLQKVPLNGGTPTILASGVYQVPSIAVDATSVYFPYNGNVGKVPKGGGTPTTLGENLPYGIAVDGSNVYWLQQSTMTSFSDGVLKKVPIGGGTTTTLASGLANPRCLAVDGSYVYWTENGGAGPRKVAK